jgi:hypothetical protein
MILYIYYTTAAGNSISSQLGSCCQGNRYGTEKAGGTARPSRKKTHLPVHSPPASQADRRVGSALYSLRPHWLAACRNNIRGKNAARLSQNGMIRKEGKRDEKGKNEIKQLRSAVQSTTKTISRDLQGLMGKWDRNRTKQNIFLKFRDTFCYLEQLTTYRIFASSFRENVDAKSTYIALCSVNVARGR